MAKITSGKSFTPEQVQWLERIEGHLTENLTIEPDDFDALPVFNRVGGWGRANKVFVGQLSKLISQFNEAVAL
jgi:type I restriction enzyme R subunit